MASINTDEIEDEIELINVDTLEPYRFEPVRRVNENNDAARVDEEYMIVEPNNHRINDNAWCQCGRCNIMPTVDECLCCKEVEAVTRKIEGDK